MAKSPGAIDSFSYTLLARAYMTLETTADRRFYHVVWASLLSRRSCWLKLGGMRLNNSLRAATEGIPPHELHLNLMPFGPFRVQ